MATLKACVQKARKDGFYPVYIRVTHNRTTQFIKTDKMVTKRELSKSKDITDPVVMKFCTALGNRQLFSDIADANVTLDDIANVHIITDRGQDVSFANLADIYVEKSVSQINHSDRAKTITVSATLKSENTSGVSSRVNDYLAKHPLPDEVDSAAGGIMSLIGGMIGPMITAMLIAIFLVYTVMVIQFEKFKQPLLIMMTIPFCFIAFGFPSTVLYLKTAVCYSFNNCNALVICNKAFFIWYYK